MNRMAYATVLFVATVWGGYGLSAWAPMEPLRPPSCPAVEQAYLNAPTPEIMAQLEAALVGSGCSIPTTTSAAASTFGSALTQAGCPIPSTTTSTSTSSTSTTTTTTTTRIP
ncbi:MAG: hypothetical protein ACRD2W_01330 [Acidimicrobiales bacterium]